MRARVQGRKAKNSKTCSTTRRWNKMAQSIGSPISSYSNIKNKTRQDNLQYVLLAIPFI
jgi:hypothetical protein